MSSKEDDIETLIVEVEKRPPLYLKTLKTYSDTIVKKKLWEEVYMAIDTDWGSLSPEEKLKRGAEIQKKWHNLRSCFSRELRAQQSSKSGQAASKRRKYIYFERLLFLLPDIQQRETSSNLSPDEETNEEEAIEDDDDLSVVREEEIRSPITTRPPAKEKKKNNSYEDQLLQLLKDKSNPTLPDEETNFALSLVPTLKSLPEENKIQARIEILGVLQKLKYPPRTTPSTSTLRVQQNVDDMYYRRNAPSTFSYNSSEYDQFGYHHSQNPTINPSHPVYYNEQSHDQSPDNTSSNSALTYFSKFGTETNDE